MGRLPSGFAGWRPISGVHYLGTRDEPRDIPDGHAYLQTFAPRQVQADLEIEWSGQTYGQMLNVSVNGESAANLHYTTGNESSLRAEITLATGTNDIVLQSDGPVRLAHLVVAPKIPGIVRSDFDQEGIK